MEKQISHVLNLIFMGFMDFLLFKKAREAFFVDQDVKIKYLEEL